MEDEGFGSEETVLLTLPLPAGGKPWRWRGDLNMLVLSDQLDQEGRAQAILDCQREWRRSLLHVVPENKGDAVGVA